MTTYTKVGAGQFNYHNGKILTAFEKACEGYQRFFQTIDRAEDFVRSEEDVVDLLRLQAFQTVCGLNSAEMQQILRWSLTKLHRRLLTELAKMRAARRCRCYYCRRGW